MRCLGITSRRKRCKNRCAFLLCSNHKLQWWAAVVIIATIGGLFQDVILPTKNILKIHKESEIQRFKESSIFKILVLPFNPEKNCTIESSNYEKSLYNRYLELGQKYQLDIECILALKEQCPASDFDANSIGGKYGADIVLWGHYIEECDSFNEVRLRYTVVKQSSKFNKFNNWDSDYKTIGNYKEYLSGKLFEDIDNITYKSLVILSYNSGDYSAALKYCEFVDVECDSELLAIKAIVLKMNNEIQQFQSTLETYTQCLKSEWQNTLTFKNPKIENIMELTNHFNDIWNILKSMNVLISYFNEIPLDKNTALVLDDLKLMENFMEDYLLKKMQILRNFIDDLDEMNVNS